MEKPSAVYSMPRVRVVCPDCGAGGANNGPCYCHICSYEVMMLPEQGRVLRNWGEFERSTKPAQ